jgi:hypothetical protein
LTKIITLGAYKLHIDFSNLEAFFHTLRELGLEEFSYLNWDFNLEDLQGFDIKIDIYWFNHKSLEGN